MNIQDLQGKKVAELKELAQQLNIQAISGLRKEDLVFKILEANAEAVASGQAVPKPRPRMTSKVVDIENYAPPPPKVEIAEVIQMTDEKPESLREPKKVENKNKGNKNTKPENRKDNRNPNNAGQNPNQNPKQHSNPNQNKNQRTNGKDNRNQEVNANRNNPQNRNLNTSQAPKPKFDNNKKGKGNPNQNPNAKFRRRDDRAKIDRESLPDYIKNYDLNEIKIN